MHDLNTIKKRNADKDVGKKHAEVSDSPFRYGGYRKAEPNYRHYELMVDQYQDARGPMDREIFIRQ